MSHHQKVKNKMLMINKKQKNKTKKKDKRD